jgi:ABC-2 type transport system ATP-binding protein
MAIMSALTLDTDVSFRSTTGIVKQESNDTAVDICGVRKRYGDLVALNGVSLKVEAGEVIGILGPNGAGKTTLLEIMEGLLPFDEGAVSVLGHDIGRDPAAIRGKVSITMQSTALPTLVTVGELISLYLAIYRSRATVAAITAKVGLDAKAGARVGRLSGGQKQRLAIALALIGKSRLMFFDEPTSELDPAGRRLVWDALQEDIRDGNSTLVITTHQMEEATALCDRIVILDHGAVIAAGTPNELIAAHCPGLTLVLKCDGASVERMAPGDPLLSSLTRGRDGMSLRLACDDFSDAMRHAQEIRQRIGLVIREMTVESRTLEDVFLHLTGRVLQD